jgi:hypothetical protein
MAPKEIALAAGGATRKWSKKHARNLVCPKSDPGAEGRLADELGFRYVGNDEGFVLHAAAHP